MAKMIREQQRWTKSADVLEITDHSLSRTEEGVTEIIANGGKNHQIDRKTAPLANFVYAFTSGVENFAQHGVTSAEHVD